MLRIVLELSMCEESRASQYKSFGGLGLMTAIPMSSLLLTLCVQEMLSLMRSLGPYARVLLLVSQCIAWVGSRGQ